MFGKCLVSLFFVSSLASSTSEAAAPAALAHVEAPSLKTLQGVVTANDSDRGDAHARGLIQTGLIIWGNPPGKLTQGLYNFGNAGLPNIHKKGLPSTGLIIWGNPPGKLTGTGLLGQLGTAGRAFGNKAHPGSGHARSATWTAMDGTSITLSFQRGLDLSEIDALVAPAGEWTDLTLNFDTELFLDGDIDGVPYGLSLDMGSWSIPLETPVSSDGTAEVIIDLELPELLAEAVLSNDGLVVEPGDELHDLLVSAMQDAALARTR